MAKRGIVWLRNDLRLHDNEALYKALQTCDEMLPIYIFDERHYAPTHLGFPKTGAFRAKFIIEAVTELRKYIRESLWGDLAIRIGKPEEVLKQLIAAHNITYLFYHQEVGTEEQAAEQAVQRICDEHEVTVRSYWGASLYHVDDLPFELEKLPPVFTNFRKKLEKKSEVRHSLPTPEQMTAIPDVDPGDVPTLEQLGLDPIDADKRAVLHFQGGETAALNRLTEYFWETDSLKDYKSTRNGLLGANYSSKFSPWLSVGAISPRRIYEEVQRYEREVKKNISTYWLVFELMWRDYFRFVAYNAGSKLFTLGGLKQQETDWKQDQQMFEAWRLGETGIPFIDANMKELLLTGFMSNRGRQNVASFLVHDLGIDWRWGAAWFESQLLDHDVASNYGNWNYVAGIGNDPRENRYFNILYQADKYDKKGDYVRHWIAGMDDLGKEFVHQPYNLTSDQQDLFGFRLGTDYPLPILDVNTWKSHNSFNK